jgi:hypothetical protein
MATKLEEANIAPAGKAGPVEGASAEKQPEVAPTAVSDETGNAVGHEDSKVDNTAEHLGGLSLADKENAALSSEEDATPPAPSTTTDTVQPTKGPFWPTTPVDHPLTKFYTSFEALVAEAQHAEVYGITLSTSSPFHTKLILQKFLRANQNDVEKAKQQLLETLKWRKEFDPVKAAGESYSKERFGGLGYVLEVEGVPGSENKRDVATFNIYGAVKDKKGTFGNLEGCVSTPHSQCQYYHS